MVGAGINDQSINPSSVCLPCLLVPCLHYLPHSDVDHGQVPLLQELRGMGSSYRSFIGNNSNNNGAKASGESSSAGLYGGGLEDEGAITKFLDALGDWVDPTARQSILEQVVSSKQEKERALLEHYAGTL